MENYRHDNDLCMTWVYPYKVVMDEDESVTLIIANEIFSFFGEIKELQPQRIVLSPMLDGPINQQQENRLASPLVAIHWSLCRPDDSTSKINNIGHSDIVEEDPL